MHLSSDSINDLLSLELEGMGLILASASVFANILKGLLQYHASQPLLRLLQQQSWHFLP